MITRSNVKQYILLGLYVCCGYYSFLIFELGFDHIKLNIRTGVTTWEYKMKTGDGKR